VSERVPPKWRPSTVRTPRRIIMLDALMKSDQWFRLPIHTGALAGTTVMHLYTPGHEGQYGWVGSPATQCWFCYGYVDDWRHA
jgi:hypothetical protein